MSSPTLPISYAITARVTGLAILGTIVLGLLSAWIGSDGTDPNQTGDIVAAAQAFGEQEGSLRARAWLGVPGTLLSLISAAGLYLLTRAVQPMLALAALLASATAATIGAIGVTSALVAAILVDRQGGGADPGALQALAALDYAAFHLALVLGALGSLAYFSLLYRAKLVAQIIAVLGIAASAAVAVIVGVRDFVPVLGHDTLTIAMLAANFLATVSLGFYLALKGARAPQ